jgi:hypothetical protein
LKIGEIYAGHYKSDRKSGRGRYMWLNGCIYDGEFEDDKKYISHYQEMETDISPIQMDVKLEDVGEMISWPSSNLNFQI